MKEDHIEVVNGRECEPLTLKNGDTIYFVHTIKGREYRLLKPLIGNMVKVHLDKGAKNITMDAGVYFEATLNAFTVLAYLIKTKDNKELAPTIEYFDSLEEVEDMDAVSKKLESMINEKKILKMM